MSSSPVLKVNHLCLERGGRRLAEPLDLELHRGERGLIHGGNGSGKTTLMETLCGLLPVTNGMVEHIGCIGYVPQEPLFPHHLTCRDYLNQLLQLSGRARGQRKQEVSRALEQFQLQAHAADQVGSLSRGWRQRLNLARAWLGQPELLLLDEPQTALDPEGMVTLEEAIQQATASAVLVVAPESVGCDSLGPLLASLQTPEQV